MKVFANGFVPWSATKELLRYFSFNNSFAQKPKHLAIFCIRKLSVVVFLFSCVLLANSFTELNGFSFAFKVVAPKKEKLAGAEAELKRQMDKLNAKRAELKEVPLFSILTYRNNCTLSYLYEILFL